MKSANGRGNKAAALANNDKATLGLAMPAASSALTTPRKKRSESKENTSAPQTPPTSGQQSRASATRKGAGKAKPTKIFDIAKTSEGTAAVKEEKDILTGDQTPSSRSSKQANPSSGSGSGSISSVSTPPPKSKLKAKTFEVEPRVDKIYKMIHKATGTLGGNGYCGAIYGELTMGSMQKVVNILVGKCEMNSQSRFIDVGSGLGKPNLHVAQDPAVRLSIGVELETIRWQLAMYQLHRILPEMEDSLTLPTPTVSDSDSNFDVTSTPQASRRTYAEATIGNKKLYCNTNFIGEDIDNASSTDPFTHIYMYDLGFPPPLQQSIANKFNTSVHARYLVSYRPPHRVIHEYGYNVELVDQLSTSMHGSGEVHTAYFYKRILTESPAVPRNAIKVVIPRRPGFVGEKDVEVVCAEAFVDAVKLAVGPLSALKQHVKKIADANMSAERPKRERRPRVL